MPWVSARRAGWVVHAELRAALRASPFPSFGLEELTDTRLLDTQQVFHHAGAVLRPVALIQAENEGAGKVIAVEAETGFRGGQFAAGLDVADEAGLGLPGVIHATAGTGIPDPHVGPANAAVDPARCKQRNIF